MHSSKLFLYILFTIALVTGCKSNTEPVVYDKNIDTIDRESTLIFQLLENGNLTKAEEQLTENLKILPDNIELLNLKAWLLLVKQDYNQAEDMFQDLLKKKESNPLAYAALGRIYRLRGDYDQAMKYIKRGITLRSSLSVLWLEKGIINFSLAEYRQAQLDFNRAALLNSESNDARFFRYLTMLKSGREIDEIKSAWENIVKNQSAKSWYYVYHAATLDELGMDTIALEVAQSGLYNYPDEPYILNMTAWLLYKKHIKSPDTQLLLQAEQHITRCLNIGSSLEPEFVDTWFSILFENGRYDQIKTELDRYLLLIPDSDLLYDWQKRIRETRQN
jgi:tetratricopeptide (TPR) repeat protein